MFLMAVRLPTLSRSMNKSWYGASIRERRKHQFVRTLATLFHATKDQLGIAERRDRQIAWSAALHSIFDRMWSKLQDWRHEERRGTREVDVKKRTGD